MKKRKLDVGESSNNIVKHKSSRGISDDFLLESKHKIFLSHSGVQKEFVEHLCQALERRCYYPFFDRHPESLPKGREFPSLIVKAAQQCQLLVVVVSEEYFMSKWPMIELNAFMQASKVLKSNENVAILPLFYGLSIHDLKDEERRQKWYEKWETFALEDQEGRIKVEDWKYALNELTKFNGLSYDQETKAIVAYENEIVSHICRLVSPDIKWDDSHVQGNAHEVVLQKRKEIGPSPRDKVQVMGIYGVGGIGKTTMCKRLCNELSSEYEGRVCHIEFDITCSNSKELLQKASIELTKKQVVDVQQLGEGECKDILRRNLFKQRTFLALDNVWDDDHSIKQALLFLNLGFHEESFVVVTARSESTLKRLGIARTTCFEMPELGHGEAIKLFLDHATHGKQFSTQEDMCFIEKCIAKCYFRKGDERGFHYHPLALEVLGRQLGCFGEMPCEWVQKLGGGLGQNVVFDVLKIGFDLLKPREQALFMDVGVYFSPKSWNLHVSMFFKLMIMFSRREDLFGWGTHLSSVHKSNEGDIQSQLDNLTNKGLLQDSDFSRNKINMHDLYVEFAKLEAKGSFDETTYLENRRWMYVDDGDLSELQVTPRGGYWPMLTRLCIWQYSTNLITSFEGIEWHHFSRVLVLRLEAIRSVHGTLNLKGMSCLRSLRVHGLDSLDCLEGFSGLINLSIFEWREGFPVRFGTEKTYFVGCFPSSLKFLSILSRHVVLEPNVFARCTLLCKLYLHDVDVGDLLDLSNCSSLDTMELHSILKWQTRLVLCASKASTLKSLSIKWKQQAFINISVTIPGLDQIVGLEHLHLGGYKLQGLPNLLALTKLQSLTLDGFDKLPELCFPHQVHKLSLVNGSFTTSNLSGCKQLQVLNLSNNHQVTHIFGMGDLIALRDLDLEDCKCLQRLPDLTKARSLQDLSLMGCLALKLFEEDIQMLAALPLLHPTYFLASDRDIARVDFARRTVLTILGVKDLGQPPINVFGQR